MKKFTLFALMVGLTLGVFAQLDRKRQTQFLKTEKCTATKVIKSIDLKSASATISNISWEEVEASEQDYAGFKVKFNVTKGGDATKYYSTIYTKNQLENFVDTSSDYSTMEEYLVDYANYLDGQGREPFKTENQELTFSGLFGNTDYEIYVLAVGETDDDAIVITQDFTTPSSTKSGTPEITSISKTDYTDQGAIEWEVELNHNVKEYYFLCEKNVDAMYYINNYGLEEEVGYKYELYDWLNSKYGSYFIFDAVYDPNEMFKTDPFENTSYQVGTQYVYMSLPINGNNDMGDFKYVVFTYGSNGLADVTEFVNTTIYPNPTTDIINISSKINMNKVELYNSLGQVVYTKEVNANEVIIPVSNFDKGAYLVKAYSKDMVVSQKVMVK